MKKCRLRLGAALLHFERVMMWIISDGWHALSRAAG